MSIDNFKEQMYKRSSKEHMQKHLEDVYGIHIEQINELDIGVFRVDRYDGPSWIARQFPKARLVESVKGDAEILNFLEQNKYPAERCAHPDAVSTLEGQGVLVTNFVQGIKLKGSTRAYYFLGILLGNLHSLSTDSIAILRRGGAWHHLAAEGGPREEIDAALSLLTECEEIVPVKQYSIYETLLNRLKECSDFHDMPQALIHPDFAPANMIRIDTGNWVVVDWAGAGLGPRIWSLGFLLWAAGFRKNMECVDAVVATYRKFINLDNDELVQLSGAIGIRPLIFNCWAFCMGKKGLLDIARELPGIHDAAKVIAERAVQAFKS